MSISLGDEAVSWWPSGKKKQTGRWSTSSPSAEFRADSQFQ